MLEMLTGVINASWQVLNDSAIYCLFGIFMSGVLKSFMSDDFVAEHLGTNNITSVVKASLLGIPLPLCSCGVIPVAMGLRRQGAGKGPTTAFLISTPETGVDSIAITYALLDPIMTVVRPVAAFITATVAGILVNFMPDGKEVRPVNGGAGCSSTCSCSCGPDDTDQNSGHGHGHSLMQRVKAGLGFAFGDMLSDIGPSLLAGIVIAGCISYFVPNGFIEQNLGAGIRPMLVMLAVGIPLYVCATASTPIVAALALKGLTPGAALVFLLAGPATNIAAILVVARLMGKRVAAVYVSVIAVVALALGMAVNKVYELLSISITGWAAITHSTHGGILTDASALLLLALILKAGFSSRAKNLYHANKGRI